jgi:hypothetical protein
MKKAFLALVLVCGLVSMGQAADPKYCVGMEVDGDQILHVSYEARPLEKGETFDKTRKGTLEKQYLDGFNSGERFGKVATVETKKDLTIGEIQVPAGKYAAGFNADEKGNFYFVVWVGEEAKKTKIEIKEHQSASIPNLTLMLGPAENGSALMALYGKYYSIIPLKVGGVKAEGAAGSGTSKVEEKKAEGPKTAAAEPPKEEKKGDAAAEGEDEDSWDDLNTHSFSGR